MNSLGQRTVDVGGHRLRVESRGAGRENFLLLHGLVDTLSIWDALVPLLEGRGRVVRFDQRAHGGSDAPPGPYRRGDLARDAIGVLDALGIERAVLVGHSMGGKAVMMLALLHPENIRRIVICDIAPVTYGHTQQGMINAMRTVPFRHRHWRRN